MPLHNVLEAACKAIKASPAAFDGEAKPLLDDHRYNDLVTWITTQVEAKVGKREAKRLFAGDDEIYAVTGSRRMAIPAAQLLGPAFLDALAKELWRLDAISLAAKYNLKTKPTAESLWRGSTGARLTHHMVRLESQNYGLIAMVRGKWTFYEGTRDDILATVPDGLMESAVAAVMGSPTTKPSKKQPKAAHEPVIVDMGNDKLAAVAMGPDGTAYVLTKRGRLGTMAARDLAWSDAENAKGMAASKNGTVVTWGPQGVTTWKAGKATRISPSAADGAHVDDEGHITWWLDEAIVIGKKRVKGFGKQTVSVLHGGAVLAVGPKASKLFGAKTIELPFGGAGHAVSGDRVALWEKKSKSVRCVALKDGTELFTAKLDSDGINHAVFAADGRLFVRYHKGLRVAVIDAAGTVTHRIECRRLGSAGSTVRSVFPLERGEVLAFANYPRGEAVLVDVESQARARWTLGTLYVGGTTLFAEGGGRLILTHNHLVQRVLVV
jgi:hypothetical protein